uniref:Putative LOV domain-containing protein n=1 Tax=Scapania nemorea TaxID=41848 RepID=A0A126WZF0_SCANE|nr:putative LOV domain-containing protein [Scapania nemorea]
MGREFANEEGACKRTGKVNSLVESLRSRYTDRLKESLRNYEFNFVISDPRLPENPIVYASEGFCNMSGYSRDEVLGRNCRFLQGPGTDRRTVLELRDAIREERSAQVRILNYTKEGKPFWNLFHLAPVFSKADGTVTHFVGVQTPISCELATSQPEKDISLSLPNLSSERGQKFPLAVDELNDLQTNVGLDVGFPEPCCSKLHSGDRELNGSLNFFADSDRNLDRFVLSSSGKDIHGSATCAYHAFETPSIDGAGPFDACKPQEPESITATRATRSIVTQLVESSKGKGEVIESRDKQVSECTTSGVVCSSLLLSLTRIQQSFVLADPHLRDMPIVHASDLFLHLTGYSREEVMGQNCRFLQGPGTDPAAVAQIRESVELEKSCSVRLLNYRKDKRPFWNLLHVSPVRCSKGKVSFYVGVQLHVAAVEKEEEEGIGMNGHQKQLGAVAAVRVAVRSLQGTGLRRTIIKSASG